MHAKKPWPSFLLIVSSLLLVGCASKQPQTRAEFRDHIQECRSLGMSYHHMDPAYPSVSTTVENIRESNSAEEFEARQSAAETGSSAGRTFGILFTMAAEGCLPSQIKGYQKNLDPPSKSYSPDQPITVEDTVPYEKFKQEWEWSEVE